MVRRLLSSLVVLALFVLPSFARGQCPLPDVNNSFYVPQVGAVATPTEGTGATRFFRVCPNNDGGASLPNNARIKIVLIDATTGGPMAGVPKEQIYMLFNGGTTAQGFFGIGADSIIANGTWNVSPLCPDVRDVIADAPTDAGGVTYITFGGSLPGSPGVYQRDPNRKWGHFDTEIPVYVGKPPCNPIQIKGKLTSASALGSYVLRIKNFDSAGGLGAILDQGERVTVLDYNTCVACITAPAGPFCYWYDFDYTGAVSVTDFNSISVHVTHRCDTPLP